MSRRADGRRRFAGTAVGALAVLLVGLPGSAPADEAPLPSSCRPHPAHVVNPGCVPALTEPVLEPPHTYPDLVPDVRSVYVDRPTLGIDPETFQFVYGPLSLHFDTWSQNLGTVAMDLVADDPTEPQGSTVSQCLAWMSPWVCRERRQVGGFSWHEEHRHFHFQDFATYELRRLLSDGSPDYSSTGLIAGSDKVSFCLLDWERVRDDAFPVATYDGLCTHTRQGISAGWADVYGPGLPGQQLSVEGLTDGRYAVIVSMNPAQRLSEAAYDNNVVEVTVELSQGLTEAAVVGRRYPGNGSG